MDHKIQRLFHSLEKVSPAFWMAFGTVSITLLGLLDYLTGTEFAFSLFYLAPIVLVTWETNFVLGVAMSMFSAVALLTAEIIGGTHYSHVIFYFLNTLVRALLYIIVAWFLAGLKRAQEQEYQAARTDFVTGLANRRYFHELLGMEIDRIRRYPHSITLAYMDTDNFKLVNDLFGHEVGDEVLRSIARELQSQLRKTDMVARLGGDEFGLLLPSTRLKDAQVVMPRLLTHLRQAMGRKNWPVTFSMGVIVCHSPPHSVEELISMADELMYDVKNSTKDNILCAVWDGQRFRKLEV